MREQSGGAVVCGIDPDVSEGPVMAASLAQAPDGGRHAEIRLGRALDTQVAAPLCRAVAAHARAGATVLELDMADVGHVDSAGLAALHQVGAFAAARAIAVSLVSSRALHRALLDGQILEQFTLAPPRPWRARPAPDCLEPDSTGPGPIIATSRNLALRLPTAEDLPHFDGWAHNPLLTHMVGSDLLYRCRHLGSGHPEVSALIMGDPSSLTALVEPLTASGEPVGFVRLYGIRLTSAIGFLETAVASAYACRRGWGVEASRLLVVYAMDALRLHRIEAKVFGYNAPSINALTRNNFQQEGVLRDAWRLDGTRGDILVFSILEDEVRHQRQREQYPYMGFWERAPGISTSGNGSA